MGVGIGVQGCDEQATAALGTVAAADGFESVRGELGIDPDLAEVTHGDDPPAE
jgi:hypothetical protein